MGETDENNDGNRVHVATARHVVAVRRAKYPSDAPGLLGRDKRDPPLEPETNAI